MLKEKIATLSYSKFRDQFGLVVIEADATEQIVRVGLAVFWDRKKNQLYTIKDRFII